MLYIYKAGAIQTLTPSGDDEQLRGEYLKYVFDLMYKTKCPVVYLANDYSKEADPQANVLAFEQCEYSQEITNIRNIR